VLINIKPSPGVDALYAPRRTVLDPILVRAAVDAGADVHHRTAVTDLLWRNGRVAGVRATTDHGRAVELYAQLVIGADGIRSTVARRLDAPFTRVGRYASAVTYGYWSDLQLDGYEWVFERDACSGVIPTNDGQACVFASAPPVTVGRGGRQRLEDIVAVGAPELADRLRRATPPRGTRTWSGHHGFLRRSSGPGWALVGDAGYFKDPISAHGLTDALRDAELLARAVIGSGIQPGTDRDIDLGGNGSTLDDAVAEYEATRDRLSIPLFDVTDQIASHRWNHAEVSVLLLQLSAAMTDEVEMLASLQSELVP
jgi:flavin-dependent dehydrogenase